MAFRKKTTFVIGAGASAEFGLPVGTALAANIKRAAIVKQKLPDNFMSSYITSLNSNAEFNDALSAVRDIHNGIHTAVSIDAFMHRRRANPVVQHLGRMLIALEVLKAEAEATLSEENWKVFAADSDHQIKRGDRVFINPDYTWIGNFLRILCDGIEDPDKVGEDVNIICFNYDRCIEHYLTVSLAAAYAISIEEALHIVETKFNIIHPYGYLGKLLPIAGKASEDRIAFGFDLGMYGAPGHRASAIERIAKGIRTYTERTHHASLISGIHDAMRDCKVLVFLGFGFNNQNMNLLRVRGNTVGSTPSQVYVSGRGFETQVHTTLVRRIGDLYNEADKNMDHWKSRIHIEYGQTAQRLFEIHHPNLTSFSRGWFDDISAEYMLDSRTD